MFGELLSGAGTLHERIERGIRDAIRAGVLQPGTRLPSTRSLAGELGISRGVVTEAYGQLAAEGYLTARQGASFRVAAVVRAPAPRAAAPLRQSFEFDFDPGLPDTASFPRGAWLRSLRSAWQGAPFQALAYPDPRGLPALRQALLDYLARVRGVAGDQERMIVTGGFSEALTLLSRWLTSQGVGAVAIEDPGWHQHALILEQCGLQVIPIPVDGEGLRVDLLAQSAAAAVVLTPAHQFPTGAVLSTARRAALIEWAESGDRLIVEDDYDSECRYDGARVGALQGLAPERVVHIGSASKRLAPGLRRGWMLLPSWLAWPLVSAKAVEDGGAEVIGQLALADFIGRGELDRHLRRMRAHYQRRRRAAIAALARWLPEARPRDSAAGLFELVELPASLAEMDLTAAASAAGASVEMLSLHCYSVSLPPGLVLGFGGLPEPALERGIRAIARALAGGA